MTFGKRQMGTRSSVRRGRPHGRWVRQGSLVIAMDVQPPGDRTAHKAREAPLAQEFDEANLPTLRRGARGLTVKKLQRRLNTLGFAAGDVDGTFGQATERAVRAFQRARGLSDDGIVGQRTWDRLLPDLSIVPAGWVRRDRLAAAGFRQRSFGGSEVWVHPLGDEVWIVGAGEGKARRPEHGNVAEIRHRATECESARERLIAGAADVRQRVGAIGYGTHYSALMAEFNAFQSDLLEARKAAQELRASTPTAELEMLEAQVSRLEGLEAWRLEFLRNTLARLPQP